MAYSTAERFSTVTEALSQRTVDYLKKLLNLLPVDNKPTRKADLVKAIAVHLHGKKLRAVWENLDSLQQLAVSEAAFSEHGQFQPDQFQAKYRSQPNWGEGSKYVYGYIDKPSHLGLFFHSGDRYSSQPGITLPDDLKQELRLFVPQPAAFTLSTCKATPTVWEIERKRFDYTSRTRQI